MYAILDPAGCPLWGFNHDAIHFKHEYEQDSRCHALGASIIYSSRDFGMNGGTSETDSCITDEFVAWDVSAGKGKFPR
jgi:hypothetical protein